MGSWVFQPQAGPEGEDGKSAYEIAVENGFVGTEQEWLDSLVGPGEDGKSAYEIAVENGFVGTEQEWLDSLVGPEGPDGPGGTVAATPYEQIEVVGPTLELADATFGHLLPNTAHFDQIEMFPVGMIISWVGDYGQVPNGWLLCHGQNLTGYETDLLRLYQIMPDYHGVGYFHTPDFRGRSPIGEGGAGAAREWMRGERWGDKLPGEHAHVITSTNPIKGLFGADGPVVNGYSMGGLIPAVDNTQQFYAHPNIPADDYADKGIGQCLNYQPSTGVNFLIYCGQDTFAIKDRDDLGNVDVVTTRMMIEARLAEKGIGEEEVKMLKEQLEEIKRTEAK